jgi:nucleotide-binding universal stress UspA family protein
MTELNARILIPTDGTAFANRVLSHVRPLLRGRTEVALLHVYADRVLDDPEVATHAISRARRRLERLESLVERWGARAKTAVMVGDPSDEIAAYARSYEPTLIAMATHGREGLDRWIRGSVAESVLRASEQPVLLVSSRALASRRKKIRRILVPLDGSDRSRAALPEARRLARAHGAELLLLHVVGVPTASSSADDTIMTRTEARGYLEALSPEAAGVSSRTVLGTGKPGAAILRAIKREGADLVVMSSHGRSGVARWILGSVAEEVLRGCECPVLVLRSARAPAKKNAAPRVSHSS